MIASELIKTGLKAGDKLYYCLRSRVEEYTVVFINKQKNVLFVFADGEGTMYVSGVIDEGFELTRTAAIEKRLSVLDAWRRDVEKLCLTTKDSESCK